MALTEVFYMCAGYGCKLWRWRTGRPHVSQAPEQERRRLCRQLRARRRRPSALRHPCAAGAAVQQVRLQRPRQCLCVSSDRCCMVLNVAAAFSARALLAFIKRHHINLLGLCTTVLSGWQLRTTATAGGMLLSTALAVCTWSFCPCC